MRFYPDEVPEFEFEPLKNRFEIRKFENGFGYGIVSNAEFEPGQIVFAFTGFLLDRMTQFSLETPEGKHLHDPFFMGKLLHSCDPNTTCDMNRRVFVATKKIVPGTVVTMDYEQTESRLFKAFECHCGAKNCKGLIRGYLFQRAAV